MAYNNWVFREIPAKARVLHTSKHYAATSSAFALGLLRFLRWTIIPRSFRDNPHPANIIAVRQCSNLSSRSRSFMPKSHQKPKIRTAPEPLSLPRQFRAPMILTSTIKILARCKKSPMRVKIFIVFFGYESRQLYPVPPPLCRFLFPYQKVISDSPRFLAANDLSTLACPYIATIIIRCAMIHGRSGLNIYRSTPSLRWFPSRD